jgi:hypothetical protein
MAKKKRNWKSLPAVGATKGIANYTYVLQIAETRLADA